MEVTWSNGSLTARAASLSTTHTSTKGVIDKGKWYWEVTIDQAGLVFLGVLFKDVATLTGNTQISAYQRSYSSNGYKRHGNLGTNTDYGEEYDSGDIISILLDMDNGTLSFYKNGIDLGIAYNDLLESNGVYAHFTNARSGATSIVTANFGATPFKYKIPIGYMSLDESQEGIFKKALLKSKNKIYSFKSEKALTQLLSDSLENFIDYGTPSVDNFDLISENKKYVLQSTISENADGLWVQELNRKPLSIKFE